MTLEPITIDINTTLEVIAKYKELSVVLTDVGSMYIKYQKNHCNKRIKVTMFLYGLKGEVLDQY